MTRLLEHVKRVAGEDVRTFFAPFKGALDAIRKELRRSDPGFYRNLNADDLATKRSGEGAHNGTRHH